MKAPVSKVALLTTKDTVRNNLNQAAKKSIKDQGRGLSPLTKGPEGRGHSPLTKRQEGRRHSSLKNRQEWSGNSPKNHRRREKI